MEFTEAIKLALLSLWANKLRSILTLIGVVMAVASIIMVITLVNGANAYVANKIVGYGADLFSVSRRPSVTFSAAEYFKYEKRKILHYEDYEAVRDGCTYCTETGAMVYKNTRVVVGNHSSDNTQMQAGTWNWLEISNINIALGRDLTPVDVDKATRNAVIGYDIVDNLLGGVDPIGKEIRVDGARFTVIGVGERQGKILGESQDNWVVIPITTFQHTYGTNDSVHIFARAGSNAQTMENAIDQVRVIMRARRHNTVGTPDDFEIETNDTFLSIWKQISSLFIWVVLGLASISLVIGGVVIMNIMLVSVTERTREIGIRKALGAKQRDILLHFLIESATMALAGGAIGVLAGIIVAKVITLVIGFPTSVQLWSVLLGLFVAGATGIFFGVYPASKAAKLDPIAALRAEL
jgi:putative ABC transport system permease protein